AGVFAARTFIELGFPVHVSRDDVAAALTSPAARDVLLAFTRGALRYRLAFASGHRRAEVQRIAAAAASRWPALVNDPSDTTGSDRGAPPGAASAPPGRGAARPAPPRGPALRGASPRRPGRPPPDAGRRAGPHRRRPRRRRRLGPFRRLRRRADRARPPRPLP